MTQGSRARQRRWGTLRWEPHHVKRCPWDTRTCEAGQQPSKDVIGFLRELRATIGAERPLVVGLVQDRGDEGFADAEADEHEAWRRALLALGDAHLWLEGLEGVV